MHQMLSAFHVQTHVSSYNIEELFLKVRMISKRIPLDTHPVFSSRLHLPKPQRARQQFTTEFLAAQVNGAKVVTTWPVLVQGQSPVGARLPRESASAHGSTHKMHRHLSSKRLWLF